MNKKFISIIALITAMSFSSLVFAQTPANYTFSGFGGGLPSSAQIVETSYQQPAQLSSTSSSADSSTILITSLVIGGVLAIGGLVLLGTMSAPGGKTAMEECYVDLYGACLEASVDACIESACSSGLAL